MVDKPVQIGTETVSYTEDEITGYETENYTEMEQVQTGTTDEIYTVRERFKIGEETVIKYKNETTQTGTETVTYTNTEDIIETRTVEKTRTVTKLVPLSEIDPSAGGGTVGGSGATDIMVEIEVEETYTVQEDFVVGTKTTTYTVEEPVYETVKVPYEETDNVYEWRKVEYTREVPVYEEQEVAKTREVPIVETVTKTREDPIYEVQSVEEDYRVNDYETITETWTEEVYVQPELVETHTLDLPEGSGGTMYIDGRVNTLEGDLNGRLTLVVNEKVRVTGNIQYVDDAGNTAMINGTSTSYTEKYQRNELYKGNSTLGVISRDDILVTSSVPDYSEVNGTLMSTGGRVGIDGFVTMEDGELVKSSRKNRNKYYTEAQHEEYRAYQKTIWKHGTFKKSAFRRIGGVVSNNRILETWIRTKDGISEVQYGFVSGNMQFDINLLFNPPPNFVEVPRPVLTYFVPVMLVRDHN
jgi:cytoskeletal protein CcmA (bactofilin family)